MSKWSGRFDGNCEAKVAHNRLSGLLVASVAARAPGQSDRSRVAERHASDPTKRWYYDTCHVPRVFETVRIVANRIGAFLIASSLFIVGPPAVVSLHRP
jgi:hypothetical protein